MLFVHTAKPSPTWEILERKGKGHPDTLADSLGEELSVQYSHYTQSEFGAVLHHNFDKTAILGGGARVAFGDSCMTAPVRVLVNGRASRSFAGKEIPLKELIERTVYDFFSQRFGERLKTKDIRIIYEVSTSSSPGAVEGYEGDRPNPRHKWFAPQSLADLPELRALNCNDTSVGCYTLPRTPLSQYVLEMERIIHDSPANKDSRVGTDIKIMGVQHENRAEITAAVPLLADKVGSIDEFFDTMNSIRRYITSDFNEKHPDIEFALTINPLDNRTTGDVYLTHTGSCIESGDEGVVGRGNRIGGLIRVNRAMSMEGICGKNPVYHTGKVLAGAAHEIMNSVGAAEEATLYLVGQRGRSLVQPWFAVLEGPQEYIAEHGSRVQKLTEDTLRDLSSVTNKFLNREIRLC